MTTGGYWLLDIPRPAQRMIHIHAGAEELGRVYQPDLAINATPRGFASLLNTVPTMGNPRWSDWRASARADYEAWQEPLRWQGRCRWRRSRCGCVIGSRRRDRNERRGQLLDVDAPIPPLPPPRTQLAPTSGSMGYGCQPRSQRSCATRPCGRLHGR
jgi:acetolactate synthase-1/2/3 large subunit